VVLRNRPCCPIEVLNQQITCLLKRSQNINKKTWDDDDKDPNNFQTANLYHVVSNIVANGTCGIDDDPCVLTVCRWGFNPLLIYLLFFLVYSVHIKRLKEGVCQSCRCKFGKPECFSNRQIYFYSSINLLFCFDKK